jgi:hypothetical protein
MPPPLPPQVIVSGVNGQPVQPRLEHFSRSKLVQGVVEADKHVLRNIFYVLRPPYQPRYSPKDPFPVGSDNPIESGVVAVPGVLDEFEVNQHLGITALLPRNWKALPILTRLPALPPRLGGFPESCFPADRRSP